MQLYATYTFGQGLLTVLDQYDKDLCSATMKTTGACQSDLPPEARG